jgi:hypothetical protein
MYSQLKPSFRQIRLLHVQPGAWNDDIECHLETVSLNDSPHYKALSYVWGDLQNNRSIAVDCESLEIPRSLFAGLQRLRGEKETLTI